MHSLAPFEASILDVRRFIPVSSMFQIPHRHSSIPYVFLVVSGSRNEHLSTLSSLLAVAPGDLNEKSWRLLRRRHRMSGGIPLKLVISKCQNEEMCLC